MSLPPPPHVRVVFIPSSVRVDGFVGGWGWWGGRVKVRHKKQTLLCAEVVLSSGFHCTLNFVSAVSRACLEQWLKAEFD